MKEVTIYTDGACSGNPGPGGWAAILVYYSNNGTKINKKEIYDGPAADTTNIKMEMAAVINAIRALKEPCKVTIHTDLQLIVDAFNKGWLQSWEKNGWKTSKGDPVKNTDLWQMLLSDVVAGGHEVTVVKVKGHSGDPLNERCDELAKAAAAS